MKRPSPALAISILALFVALGGTSYAVTQLPKNSVGTSQLKKNAVTGVKVKDGSLGGTDIDLGTLGTVPSASSANRAGSAQTADRAGTAGSADRATTAGSAATAGSADHATTANSATSAGSAATATNAANSQALNGMTAEQLTAASKLQCPAGMKLAAGACLDEQTAGTATLYYSFLACGEVNRRLPTKGELVAYVSQYLPVGSSLTAWIEPENPSGEQTGVYVTGTVFPEEIEFSTYTSLPDAARTYRCATAASN